MNDQLYWVAPDGTAHEACQLLFTSTGELVPFDPGAHPEMGWFRNSWAYFCPDCGDIWERILLINSKGQAQYFDVLRVACRKHKDSWNVAGSRLAYRLEGLLAIMPPAVLREEFEVHLKYIQQESSLDNNNGSSSTGSLRTIGG